MLLVFDIFDSYFYIKVYFTSSLIILKLTPYSDNVNWTNNTVFRKRILCTVIFNEIERQNGMNIYRVFAMTKCDKAQCQQNSVFSIYYAG